MIIFDQKNPQSSFRQAISEIMRLINQRKGYILAFVAILTAIVVTLSQSVLFTPRIILNSEAHFFQSPTTITLQQLGFPKNREIRYTLDGSSPQANSNLYLEPLVINKTATLRAALFRVDGRQIGQELIRDLFINSNHQLPIVSIITQPEYLWDDDIGIYVEGNYDNYAQKGKDWQRAALFNYYESGQTDLSYTKQIGLRIHGGGSRELPQKTLRLYSSHDDNDDLFDYPFFENYHTTLFNTLILRNSGNDWGNAFMRDMVIARIAAKNTNLDYMVGRPVVVYLNGEYWGIHYLRDRYDKEYLHQLHKVDPSRIKMIEVSLDDGEEFSFAVAEDEESKADAKAYNNLLREAMACDNCPQYHYFNKFIDLDNLIDYFIFELHFMNLDWVNNNINIWRYDNVLTAKDPSLSQHFPSGQDGRFRYHLFDMDSTFAEHAEDEERIIHSALNSAYGGLVDTHFPFRNLFNNSTFQENFFNRYANLLNTTLSTKAVNGEIDSLVSEIFEEMPRHIERWKDYESPSGTKFSQSMDQWLYQVELIKIFVDHRADGMRANTIKEFIDESGSLEMIKVEVDISHPEAGDIIIHDTLIPGSQLPFTGLYFPAHAMNLEAVPKKGYRFVQWEGDVHDQHKHKQKIRITLNQSYQLTAIFEKR